MQNDLKGNLNGNFAIYKTVSEAIAKKTIATGCKCSTDPVVAPFKTNEVPFSTYMGKQAKFGNFCPFEAHIGIIEPPQSLTSPKGANLCRR